MPNDPKWRTIARAAKQTIPVVLAVYVHLLTIASGAVDRGTLVNVNSEDLASALDVDSEAVDAILEAMQGRVLDGDKLSGWEKRQTNREDSSTERVKRYRERKVTQMKHTVTQVKPDVTADKKREEEIRQEESTKTLASTALAVPAARGKLVCTLPLNQGDHEVFEVDVQEWIPLYPAVDIRQELRNMKGWLLGNPKLRKTKTGIGRFINAWFSRAQNESRPGAGNGTFNRNHGKTGGNVDALATALALVDQRDYETADEVLGAETGPGKSGDSLDLRGRSSELPLGRYRSGATIDLLPPPR
jgi:hypothetical protein